MIRQYSGSEFSEAALAVHVAGGEVFVEHVAPLRELTREAIKLITDGCTDDQLMDYVRSQYRLVLLTAEETRGLNRVNRSRLDPKRIDHLSVVRRT